MDKARSIMHGQWSRLTGRLRRALGLVKPGQMEEELRESEANLQAILQSTTDGILAVNSDNRVLFSNEHFAQMWQIPTEVMSGKDDAVLLRYVLDQLDDPQDFLQKVRTLYQSEEESFDTLNFKDGRTFERVSRPLMQNGKARGRVWSFRDITKQTRAERALALSEERFRLVIELSFDAVSLLDENIHVIYSSPGVERLLGYTAEERDGRDALELIHPDDLPVIKAMIEKSLKVPTEDISGQARFLNKDGNWRWFEGTISNLLGVPAVRAIVSRSRDITGRKRLEELLQQQATTDELTGCANRRHFMELARAEIIRSVRFKRSLALAIIDADHFKQINDTYGHAAGDRVLTAFTKTCQQNIREIDVLARLGGDEFALLFPEANCAQASEIIERVRQALTSLPVDVGGNQVLITISCGISDLTDGIESLDTLLGNADQALYRAKEMGRNRAVVWRKGMESMNETKDNQF